MYQVALKIAVVGVVLNVFFSAVLSPFATQDQKNPPLHVQDLSYFDQMMHMFVHHNQVPIVSSVIVFAIVFGSVVISDLIF